MEENFLEETLKINLKQLIRSKVEGEIEELVSEFRNKLESRKDDYIAEIMKGIRISHEYDPIGFGMNYKIIFENRVTIEKEEPAKINKILSYAEIDAIYGMDERRLNDEFVQ